MTERTLKEKAAKLVGINGQIADLQARADALRAAIIAEMEARTVDELKAGNSLIRYKEVTSTRLDTKAFKEAHKGLYDQYAKTSTTRRFTLIPA
jgi:predicted phage-related endonuclease